MTQKYMKSVAVFILGLAAFMVNAQNDSLILNNGNVIVGEIKSMEKGVLKIETDYSDADFTIEIEGIKEVYSNARFLFTTSEARGTRGLFAPDLVI
jgi:hypothetical protein